MKKSKKDSDDPSRELCKGYMMRGEEIRVKGGITLDFKVQNIFYYVLKANEPSGFKMEVYRNEKHARKKKDPPLETKLYTGQVRVHPCTMAGKDGDRDAIFVVIHSQQPVYYKPNQKQAAHWFQQFCKVSQHSKEKEQSERAIAQPMDDLLKGEYVTMSSLSHTQRMHEGTRSQPSGFSSPTAPNAPARIYENIPGDSGMKQNVRIPRVAPRPGAHNHGRHVRGGDVSNQTGVARAQTAPPRITHQHHGRPTSGVSEKDCLDRLPSKYAPQEIIFDEMEDSHWGSDDDEEDDPIGENVPRRFVPTAVSHQRRSPIKRGRSRRIHRDDGTFVWEKVDDEGIPLAPMESTSHRYLKGSKTGSLPATLTTRHGQFGDVQNELIERMGRLKKPRSPSESQVEPQSGNYVTVAYSIQHSTWRNTSAGQTGRRLGMRRRSLSDPDQGSSGRPMHILQESQELYDDFPMGQGTLAPPVFSRESEHGSSRWSERQMHSGSGFMYNKPPRTNRDRPQFESFESSRSSPSVNLGQSSDSFRDPRDPLPMPIKIIQKATTNPEKRSLPRHVREQDEQSHTYEELSSLQNSRQLLTTLRNEQAGKIMVELKKHDAIEGLVFVPFNSKIWLASWKKNVNGRAKFQQMLHIGDELISVDGRKLSDVKDAASLISSSSGDTVKLVINRIPLANVVFLTKSMTDSWGCEFVKNELIKMYPGPLKMSGIAETPFGPTGKETTWVVTECHHQPVPILTCDKDEVKNHLLTSKTELPLVFHPKDFIEGLLMNIKRKITKHASDYQL